MCCLYLEQPLGPELVGRWQPHIKLRAQPTLVGMMPSSRYPPARSRAYDIVLFLLRCILVILLRADC